MEYDLGQKLCCGQQRSTQMSLNPSFNGIWSRMVQLVCKYFVFVVLILLLLEYGLGLYYTHQCVVVYLVLILLLVEYGLGSETDDGLERASES